MSQDSLFAPFKLGPYDLKHRVVMAPLTRLRADKGDIPNDLMADYYGQRASDGGFIISEATPVTVTGRGYLGAPGIYDDAQIAGWKKITDAIHAKGGRIFMQLWHVGRTSHVDLTGGVAPVTASVGPYNGVSKTSQGWLPASPARALELNEIPGIVEAFRQGARRAKEAGFDGVEVHGANGYLLDQFLQDGSNKRTDAYGGSVENRARLLLDVVEAVASVFGGDHVGVRIGPSGTFNDMHDSDPHKTFGYVADALNRFGLAYLHVIEPRIKGSDEIGSDLQPVAVKELRKIFKGPIIAAGGFDGAGAEAVIASGDADLVAFGRSFIANPDLPSRLKNHQPLNPYNRDTFYDGGTEGYIDYPAYAQSAAA